MLCASGIGAQSLYEVDGKVTSADGSLVGAVVIMPELNVWSVTDATGYFTIKDIPYGEWLMEVRLVGYRTQTKRVVVPMERPLELTMKAESYQLDDVTITAKQGIGTGTSSVINRTAFEHQQTLSVVDALQLLPGGLTSNPSLNSSKVLTLRETEENDATTAMGTALIVDNVQMNNDANMQSFSTASTKDDDLPSTSSTGIDVRMVSTDRVESVEVVRGVASAEYGNLTSGAVIVRTRAGVSPTNAIFKVDPKLKSLSLGRGFSIGQRGAVISADIDVTKSYNDIRSKTTQYKRLTGQLAYSDTYTVGETKVLFNGKLSGYISQNVDETDVDRLESEYTKELNRNLLLNINGNWLANKAWITSMRFVASANIGYQFSEVFDVHKGELPTPYTTNLNGGEHEGLFYPMSYNEIMRVEGKPMTLQLKLTANKTHFYGDITGHLLVGAEYNLKGNNGEGKSGEYLSTDIRQRSFKDIPFVGDVSLYAEEKLRLPITCTRLEIQAGVRLTSINAEGYDFGVVADPRFNLRYVLREQRLSTVAIRGSWGVQHKMPTLSHLYPDPAYLDMISYSYLDNATQEGMSVFTSVVINDTQNNDLRLPESVNSEIGIEITQGRHFKLSATFFHENLTGGLTFKRKVAPLAYNIYAMTTERADYNEGVLSVGGVPVLYTADTTFCTYRRPVNALEREKSGVEFTLDFGKIEALNTQVIVDGMYIDMQRRDNHTDEYYTSAIINGSNRKLAVVSVNESASNVQRTKRLNTNLRLITRIPSVGLIFSLKGQCVWFDKSRRSIELDGQDMVRNIDGANVVMPLAFIDFKGEMTTTLPDDIMDNAQTKSYVQYYKDNYFWEDNPKPYAMADVRMTKEIGKWLQLSVYANNFTNRKPKRYLKSSDTYVYKNSDIYFGCDMKIKL